MVIMMVITMAIMMTMMKEILMHNDLSLDTKLASQPGFDDID